MTLKEEVADLKKRLEKLEAVPRIENHYHYHYAPTPPVYPFYVGDPMPQPWITWCETGTAAIPARNGTIN